MKKLLAGLVLTAAALSFAPASAGPVGGYCSDPVSINCTYLDGDGHPHNCYVWLAGHCEHNAS